MSKEVQGLLSAEIMGNFLLGIELNKLWFRIEDVDS